LSVLNKHWDSKNLKTSTKINSLGYLGKYQFGTETLKAVGIHNLILPESPRCKKSFCCILSKNKAILEDVIRYEGKVVNGILITESGILAAAHLGGAGSVKYFRT
jgi:hypothetical protein